MWPLMSALTLAGIAVTGAGGCTNEHRAQVAQRASFDLGCEVNVDDVEVVGNWQFDVRACGCRATYLAAAAVWVLNAASGEQCDVATSRGEQR